jgi:predicted Zn-ribbon and HTH transcriptional regulator
MNRDSRRIIEHIIGGSIAIIGLLFSLWHYENLIDLASANSLKSRLAMAIFRSINSIGGKLFLRGFILAIAIYAFSKAIFLYRKNKKQRSQIDFGTLLKKGTTINFDNKLLYILKVSWDGKKYKGYGKLFKNGEKENWKPVEFSKLTLTNDGKSKLSGQFKHLSAEEWQAKGEDINELPYKKKKIDSENVKENNWQGEPGKCPACGYNLKDHETECPECGLHLVNE